MEENESLDPVYVNLLGPKRIMLQTNGLSNLIEEFRLAWLWGGGYH
jgi:hypothetical protein